jgi:uncharacterized delta-60 repeat protein
MKPKNSIAKEEAGMRFVRFGFWFSLLLVGLLAACGESTPRLQKTTMAGTGFIFALSGDRAADDLVAEERYGTFARPYKAGLTLKHDFGPIDVHPPGKGPNAEADVFVSESGETYWVSAESARDWFYDPAEPLGSEARLHHLQGFRKTREDATLRFVISDVLLEGIDGSPHGISEEMCPWKPAILNDECEGVMHGSVDFALWVQLPFDQGSEEFYSVGGRVVLQGTYGQWKATAHTNAYATDFLWNLDTFDEDYRDNQVGWYYVRSASPITIEVPIDLLPVGTVFQVDALVKARAYQSRGVEAYMGAYFRDPASSDGLNISYEGLEPIEPLTNDIPTPAAPAPAPVCDAPNPAAGTIQFAQASYTEPEIPGSGAAIVVTRTGGSQGKVSVRFTTSDDTAIAGDDYEAVDTYVLFADGEEGERVVDVPILLDDIEEPDKTLNLTLSEPRGCATLGQQNTATLTILDDDRPIINTDYAVGGTVTGLVGSGLVLRNLGEELTLDNSGPFAFSRRSASGFRYDVQVKTQPRDPVQVCTVANGSGTVQDADVTNIVVSCAEPSPGDDALDPSFGASGKVTDGLTHPAYGGASDLALQPDGKIVAVGGRNKLARYNADGSLDASFGTGGVVEVVFQDDGIDMVKGVALQADGKIVVVGETKAIIVDDRDLDWAIARYHADGSLDTGFGTNGRIINDFGATPFGVSADGAEKVLIQPDGKIVVAGNVNRADSSGVADSNFVVMRFTASGASDTGFGPGGVTAANFDRVDILYGAALQPDGNIVVVGRVAKSGGADPDIGIVRFSADGSLDRSFGDNGLMRDETDRMWDEAADVVVQPDGKIVDAGKQGSTFLVARYDVNGDPDASFGNAGRVGDLFVNAHAHAVALQADGKIVAVGSDNDGDFGIIRLNPDGSLDTSFGSGGRLTVDFFGSYDVAKALLIQPDGKIVVGGEAQNGTQYGLGLIRVLP